MEKVVRTVYGANLQTCLFHGLPLVIKPHTTLNERLNINANVLPNSSDVLAARYFCIGNKGHGMTIGADNVPLITSVQHRPRDAGLYNQLPFVMRLPANDLTASERVNYRLRRAETHGGKTYIAYYGKAIDYTNTIPQMDYVKVVSGVSSTTSFEPKASDLTPTPPDISSTGVVTTTGDYVTATAKVPFTMSAQEVTELINVSNIIYGDSAHAIISEIAICSGIDKTVMGDFNGVQATYVDAIGVQIAAFIGAFYSMPFNTNGVSVLLNSGATEPLLIDS